MAGTAGMLWLGAALGAAQFRGLYVAGAFVPLVAGPVFDRPSRCCARPRRRRAAASPPWALAWPVRQALASLAGVPQLLAGNGRGVRGEHAAWRGCSDRRAIAALDALPPGIVLARSISAEPAACTAHIPSWRRPTTGRCGPRRRIAAFRDEKDLANVAARVGADYIVACAPPAKPGEARSVADRLGRGEITPPGLEPIPVPDTPYRVWRLSSGPAKG